MNVDAAWRGPDWFEPRLPAGRECSLAQMLAERAGRAPDDVFCVDESGAALSNAQMLARAGALAGDLVACGVVRGDRVAVWQPNGVNILAALFACSMLGATGAMLNVALRGAMLTQALSVAGAKVLFAHGDLLERLGEVDAAGVEIVLAAEPGAPLPALEVRPISPPDAARELPPVECLDPWDLAAIIYTSGTTGASKGVRVPVGQLWSVGQAYYGFLGPTDRMLISLPLFHIAALGAFWGTMSAGASVALMEAFRLDDFWGQVARSAATVGCGFPGTFAELLMKAPAGPADRAHGIRRLLVSSINPSMRAFGERFGVEIYAGYSMSECSAVTISPLGYGKDGTVGRVRKGLIPRLVDANDVEVPPGEAGELVLRATLPWVLNDGYQGAPEETTLAWRNGWFHTGDLFAADADGDLRYIDRLKDVIRRRGEGISSAQLEAEVRAYPAVRAVAAVGVATPDGEEVLVALTTREGEEVDPEALIRFLIPRVPHFMVPRFVRVLAELPMTGTNKVKKPELRAQGLAPGTWDREAAGIRVRRQSFGRKSPARDEPAAG